MTDAPARRPAALLSRIVVAGASASGMFALVAAMGATARPDDPTVGPVVVSELPAGPVPASEVPETVPPASVVTARPAPVVTEVAPPPAVPAPAEHAPAAAREAGRTHRS